MAKPGNVDAIEITRGIVTSTALPAWPDLNGDQRAAIVRLVRDSLTVLERDVAEWLPTELVIAPQASFSITVAWKLDRVDALVYEMRAAAALDE